ncbi:MAG TPA: G1 family glutamic endopeptidase [Thermoplasmata archaeon]|nr:G1 family glutamic endopeptidase [Thermoplasmata archaeon]
MSVRPRLLFHGAAFGIVALFLVLPAAGAGIGSAGVVLAHAAPAIFHARGGSTTTQSTNWAGFAISTSNGAVTDVKGSWIVPKVQGKCPSGYQYSSFWVGIDGYSSNSVEQIGTDSDCQSGSAVYYAWFEFYPNPSHLISAITVSPGNIISAEVKWASPKFTVTLKDLNTSQSFSKTSKTTHSRSSAEWIAEAPSSGSGILPLANFGTVRFGNFSTGLTGTDAAKISGKSGGIGAFSNIQITMINSAGTATKASPSALTPDGTSFNVTWKSAGP